MATRAINCNPPSGGCKGVTSSFLRQHLLFFRQRLLSDRAGQPSRPQFAAADNGVHLPRSLGRQGASILELECKHKVLQLPSKISLLLVGLCIAMCGGHDTRRLSQACSAGELAACDGDGKLARPCPSDAPVYSAHGLGLRD
jgi:hypothetical protein